MPWTSTSPVVPTADVPLPVADAYEGNSGSHAAVWVGTRLLVYAGALGSGLTHEGGVTLAYSPRTDLWTRLADAPTFAYNPPLLWTGSQAILYADPIIRLSPE